MNDEFDIEQYLNEKNLPYKIVSDQINLQTCPFCGDCKFHFYIGPSKFAYDCKKCEEKGSFNAVMKHFGDLTINPDHVTIKSTVQNRPPMSVPTTNPQDFNSKLYLEDEILDWLRTKRGFKDTTINRFTIGWNGERITIPIYDRGRLVNYRYRKDFRIDDDSAKVKQEYNCFPGLFNDGDIDGKSHIILCEGELDAMSVWQAIEEHDKTLHNKIAVISGTLGCGSWKPEWTKRLEDAKKIQIFYDNDPKGQKGVIKVAEELGFKRCKRIQLENFKDANEYFSQGKTFSDFLNDVKEENIIREDDAIKHLSEYSKYIEDYLDGKIKDEGIKTGYPRLDKILGGLKPGHVAILSGETSAGKSALAVNIMYNVSSNDKIPVLYYSMEQPPQEIANRLLLIDSGVSNESYRDRLFKTAELTELKNSLIKFEEYPIYFWEEQQRLTTKRFAETLSQSVQEKGTKLVIIDHGLYFAIGSSATATRSGEVGDLVRFIKTQAQINNVPIILLWHTKRLERGRKVPTTSDLRESSMVEKDADIIMFVVRDFLGDDPLAGAEAFVHVEKNRAGGTIGRMPLTYDMDTTRFKETPGIIQNSTTTQTQSNETQPTTDDIKEIEI